MWILSFLALVYLSIIIILSVQGIKVFIEFFQRKAERRNAKVILQLIQYLIFFFFVPFCTIASPFLLIFWISQNKLHLGQYFMIFNYSCIFVIFLQMILVVPISFLQGEFSFEQIIQVLLFFLVVVIQYSSSIFILQTEDANLLIMKTNTKDLDEDEDNDDHDHDSYCEVENED